MTTNNDETQDRRDANEPTGVATNGSVVGDGDGPQRAMKSVEVTGPVDSAVPATKPDHPNDG